MYKLAVKLRGFDAGTLLCQHADGALHVETRLYTYLICIRGDIQTFIAQGIIEEVSKPVWTDEDMMEFITRYCENNFLPLNYIDKALNEFKIYKGENS